MRSVFKVWPGGYATEQQGSEAAARSAAATPLANLRWFSPKCYAGFQFSLFFSVFLYACLEQSQLAWAAVEPDGCQPEAQVTRTATAVTGPKSLRLDDGTEVVLEGLLPPSRLDHHTVVANWKRPKLAIQALTQAAVGRSILLLGDMKRRDRYGRRIAQVRVQQMNRGIWLQAYLVQNGLARVAVEDVREACLVKALLASEDDARNKRLGLWQEAGYAIKPADKPWELMRYRSTMQIVEGKVRSVARVRSRVFVNFGRQWKTDFTIGIRRRLADQLRVQGLTVHQLKGRTVRVRGWIERRGGPFIQLKSAAQLNLAPGRQVVGEARDRDRAVAVPTFERRKKRPALREPDAIDL